MAEITIALTSFLLGIFLNFAIFQFVYSFKMEVNYFQIGKIFSKQKFSKVHYPISTIFSLVLPLVFLKFHSLNLGIYNYILFMILFVVLNFFAIFDIKNLEVPEIVTIVAPVILAVINILLLMYSKFETLELDLFGFSYSPIENLLAMFLVIIFFALVILISKGEGMGGGDIRIVGLMALILGVNTIISIYLSIILALIFSIPYAIIVTKKIRGVQIPFVPFLVLGLYLTIILGFTYSDLFILY